MNKRLSNCENEAGFISAKQLNILLSLALVIAIGYIILEKQKTEEKIQTEVAEALVTYKQSEVKSDNAFTQEEQEKDKDGKVRYNFANNAKMDHHIANAIALIRAAQLLEASNETSIEPEGVSYAEMIEADVIDVMDDPWTEKEYQNKEQIKVFKEEHEDEMQYRVELTVEDERYNINRYEFELLNGIRQDIFE